jgi:hypothetical protein
MSVVPLIARPSAWEALAQALRERRAVKVRYHGADRIVCPHVLGWKHGRPKLLAYQVAGSTSHGPLPNQLHQRWRSMFIDEIESVALTGDPWGTADNYSLDTNAVDQLEVAVPLN